MKMYIYTEEEYERLEMALLQTGLPLMDNAEKIASLIKLQSAVVAFLLNYSRNIQKECVNGD